MSPFAFSDYYTLLSRIPLLISVIPSFFSLFNGVVEVIGRFTIPLLLTVYFGYGEAGIWLSSGIVWVISGITAWIRYLTYFRSKLKLPSGSAARYSLPVMKL